MSLTDEQREQINNEIARLKKLCYRKMEDPDCKCMYCVLRSHEERKLAE